jgi:hypothetical protein
MTGLGGSVHMNRPAALPLAVAVAVAVALAASGATARAADNHRPVGRADRATTDEGTAVRLKVLSNDRDADGDRLRITSVRVVGTRGRVTVGGSGRTLVYDPAGAFDALHAGETAVDRFSYRISDLPRRRGSARAAVGGQLVQVAVTVSGVSSLPRLYDVQLDVTANTLGNRFDVFGDENFGNLTITGVTQPPHGNAYLSGGTTLGYDPPFGYCNNGNPTDDFTYTITNGTDTATGTVLTTVSCS